MTQAVFLSYASQDADAARRICDALRAAGLEVWFDQSELRGGDAWDASIRKQIKECALFLPIISASTEERLEGYFRLEWRLAEQRTHLMAKGKPFLLPIVIDNTLDAGAHVPESFLDVQWTRLPEGGEGEATATFAQRVVSLMQPSTPSPTTAAPAAVPRSQRSPAAPLSPVSITRAVPVKPLVAAGITLAATAALVFVQPWKTTLTPHPAAGSNKTSPEIKQLVAQVEDLIRDPMAATRESYVLADSLAQRLVTKEDNNAEHWVLAARVSLLMFENSYDRSAARLQSAFEQSEKALKLNPDLIAAKVVRAQYDLRAQNYAGAKQLLTQVLVTAPDDRQALRISARLAVDEGRESDAESFYARLNALPGGDPQALLSQTLWYLRAGRLREGKGKAEQLLKVSPTPTAYYVNLELFNNFAADPQAGAIFGAQIPAQFRTSPGIAGNYASALILVGRWDEALAVLKNVPQDYLAEYGINFPKGQIAGLAHELAGRPSAAAAEWRESLALVEKRLQGKTNDLRLLSDKAVLQTLLGMQKEASETLRLRVELGGKDSPPFVGLVIRNLVRAGRNAEAAERVQSAWAALSFLRRSTLVSELAYLPEYAVLRKDKRVAALIAEHFAVIKTARAAPAASAAPAIKP